MTPSRGGAMASLALPLLLLGLISRACHGFLGIPTRPSVAPAGVGRARLPYPTITLPQSSSPDQDAGRRRRGRIRPPRQKDGADDSDDEADDISDDDILEAYEDAVEEREYRALRPPALDRAPRLRREVRKNKLPLGIPLIPQGLSAALLAGVFVLGVGTGVTVDSAINTNPKDLASRDAIDKNAPNPKICQRYGASAIVLDQRVMVTFNPFNVYVTQADTKPGCVLRASNVVQVLQARGLLTDDDVNTCKNGNNTWAYVGDLNDKPQLSCVYQSDDAQNEFLSNPRVGIGDDIYDRNTGIKVPRSDK